MQDSITKALLFVIALSTSIIAVELIPQNIINRKKLACIEYNDLRSYEIDSMTFYKDGGEIKLRRFNKLQDQILGKAIDSDIDRVEDFCKTL